jgi:hypothetical protein
MPRAPGPGPSGSWGTAALELQFAHVSLPTKNITAVLYPEKSLGVGERLTSAHGNSYCYLGSDGSLQIVSASGSTRSVNATPQPPSPDVKVMWMLTPQGMLAILGQVHVPPFQTVSLWGHSFTDTSGGDFQYFEVQTWNSLVPDSIVVDNSYAIVDDITGTIQVFGGTPENTGPLIWTSN